MSNGKLADKIILDYCCSDMTAKEMFCSIPEKVLVRLIKLLEAVRKEGAIGPNSCSKCGHVHNDGNWYYNYRMLMLDRAKQTLAGVWN